MEDLRPIGQHTDDARPSVFDLLAVQSAESLMRPFVTTMFEVLQVVLIFSRVCFRN